MKKNNCIQWNLDIEKATTWYKCRARAGACPACHNLPDHQERPVVDDINNSDDKNDTGCCR
jgi:hypothetical protein